MKGPGVRPVKLLLPADVALRLDDAIAKNLGGFRDRHSLVAAAIDEYLIDLVYANESTPEPAVTQAPTSRPSPLRPSELPQSKATLTIPAVTRGVAMVDEVSALVDEPLLGLHNRDWPSLGAMAVLAEMATENPVPLREFMMEATARAWRVADQLVAEHGRKAAALLPTNRAKAQSAESAFQTFAIASVSKRANPDGRLTVSGPLPLWRTLALTREGGELSAGLTDAGWNLLEQMTGLEPTSPHGQDAASTFFDFLQRWAPSDWWGFETMLKSAAGSPTREQYLVGFASSRAWTESIAASAAQGYLARGREWGVIEPKISDGRYQLTTFGKEVIGG